MAFGKTTMRNVRLKSVLAIAFFAVLLFPGLCLSDSLEGEKYVRELIIRLNNNYIQLNRALKDLEESVRDFPSTNLYMSVIKREKGADLVSMEVWDNEKLLGSHVYSPIENQALESGGRLELYRGEIRRGNQILKVIYYWADGKKQPQKEVILIPVTVAAARTYLIELSLEKKKEKLGLNHTQFDFSTR